MILDRLELVNFCLYKGQHVMELSPSERRGKPAPIVLFGGVNGGGKTTLLDAVQLALYGNRAKCSKRNDKPYEEFLRQSIHNSVEPDEGAAISLSFRFAAEGREQLYEVTRSWSVVRDRVREKVQVRRDGRVDTWMSDNWNQLVEELIPLGISQLCFFDAEKIRFLAEDETSTEALGAAIKSLLGLDLAERLISDASVLESRIAKRAKPSQEVADFHELEVAIEAKQAGIEKLVQSRGGLENPRLAAQNRVQEAEEGFARVGGRHWKRREDRQKRRVELDREIAHLEQQLVSAAATDLPFALIPDLLCAVLEQGEREARTAEVQAVVELLADRDKRVVSFLKELRVDSDLVASMKAFLDRDRSERSDGTNEERRLLLSEGGLGLLKQLAAGGIDQRLATTEDQLNRLDTLRRELEDVNRSLAAVPEEASLRSISDQLKAASAELAGLEQQISSLDKQIEAVRIERHELEQRLRQIQQKVVDEQIQGEEDLRLIRMAQRTQQTMQEFLRRAMAAKIQRLSQFITESFRFLLRKTTLVERVQIDPATFSITLVGQDGSAISKQRLSEGEKQIFAISVLWGLSRASARPLPAIIDTPMARLDAEHRNHLVARYFPHASHQVIVLSTDTEIERTYFAELQPHLARAYHLNYDETERCTVGEEGYFWSPEEADVEEITA